MGKRKDLGSDHESQSGQIRDGNTASVPQKSRGKRVRYWSPNTLDKEESNGRKAELLRQYFVEVESRQAADRAWKWLRDLGIPCHNMGVPISLHTKAKLPVASTNSSKKLELADLKHYEANSITPEILRIYCDWKVLPKARSLPIEEKANLAILSQYRLEMKTFAYRGAAERDENSSQPVNYATRPLRPLSPQGDTISLDHYVLETISNMRTAFREATLRVPQSWKDLSDPDYRLLPEIYEDILAQANENSGKLPEEEEEGNSVGLSSPKRPASSVLLEQQMLRQSMSPGGKEQVQSLLQRFPIGNEVSAKAARRNAKAAQEELYTSTLAESYDVARRDVAIKLSAKRFARVVRWLTPGAIREADDRWGLGNILLQDSSTDPAHQTASIILHWINKRISRVVDKEVHSEGCTEKDVGGLLKDIVVSDTVGAISQKPLLLPGCLQMAGMTPSPDVLTRAKPQFYPSLVKFLPVIFAGECKKSSTEGPNTPAQLACALNGTLVLLVLMYLDMRKAENEPLPRWMFAYGILYTERGLIIRAHYPTYEFETGGDGEHLGAGVQPELPMAATEGERKQKGKGKKKRSSEVADIGAPSHLKDRRAINHSRARWIFNSEEVTSAYEGAFHDIGESQRVRLLAVLLMIQSHSLFLAQKLQTWSTGASATSAYTSFKEVL